MEKGGQKPSDMPSQMAKEGRDCMSEKRKIIMAVTQMLDSGTLDERSSQLLEQLAGYIRCPPTETAHPRGEPTETKPSEEPRVEPRANGN
jgi:hypothetical protein